MADEKKIVANEVVEEDGLLPGVRIKLGGKPYILPALNIKRLKKFDSQIKKINDDTVPDTEKLTIICEVALGAITRNYAEVTLDFMEEWVDLRNCWEVFGAIMGQSGFKEVQAGETKASA